MDKDQFSNIFFHRQSIFLLPIAFFFLCFIDAIYGYLVDFPSQSGIISTVDSYDMKREGKRSNQQYIILTLNNESISRFRVPIEAIKSNKESISSLEVGRPTTIYFAPAFLGMDQKERLYEVLKLLIERKTILDMIRIAKDVSFNLMLIYGVISLILISYYFYRLRSRLKR